MPLMKSPLSSTAVMTLLKALMSVLLLAVLTDGIEFDGRCPYIGHFNNLSKEKLNGVWYEYAKYHWTLPGGYVCRSDTYKLNKKGYIKFRTSVSRAVLVRPTNSSVKPYFDLLPTALSGRLVFKGDSSFIIKYGKNFTRKEKSFSTLWKKLRVIYTNYNGVIFLWWCREMVVQGKQINKQQLVILTRHSKLSKAEESKMKEKLDDFPVDQTLLKKTRHTDCYSIRS